jgi:hypothetical protein
MTENLLGIPSDTNKDKLLGGNEEKYQRSGKKMFLEAELLDTNCMTWLSSCLILMVSDEESHSHIIFFSFMPMSYRYRNLLVLSILSFVILAAC